MKRNRVRALGTCTYCKSGARGVALAARKDRMEIEREETERDGL